MAERFQVLLDTIEASDAAGNDEETIQLIAELKRLEAVDLTHKYDKQAEAVRNLTWGNPYPQKVVEGKEYKSPDGSYKRTYTKKALTELTPREWYTDFYKYNLDTILQDDTAGLDLKNGLSDSPKRYENPVNEADGFWEKTLSMFLTAPVYTGSGVSSVTTNGSPPRTGLSDRAAYGLMPTQRTQHAWLTDTYGADNVKFYNTPNHNLFLWRENKDDPWKMPEPLETIDFADFSSDLAGEVLPTTMSIAGGLIGAFGGNPGTMALGAGLGQGGGRFIQEALVEKTMLDEVDATRIAKRAAVEGILTTVADFTMTYGSNKLLMGWMGREGTDFFAETMRNLSYVKSDAPTIYKTPFLDQGGDVAQRVLRIESKFPNGAIANAMNEQRQQAGDAFQGVINPTSRSAGAVDDAFRQGLDHITGNLTVQRNQLLKTLDDLELQRGALNTVAEKEANKAAKKEAIETFNAQISKYEALVLSTRKISPAQAGLTARKKLADSFVDVSVQKGKNFTEAYTSLSGVATPVSDVSNVFSRHSRELITDIEGEAIGILNANARNTSNTALKRLDDLAASGGSIDFKSVNEIIQKIEEKTRRGNFVAGFDANQYKALADDLRVLRSQMLEGADPNAVAQFENANLYYRDTYLSYIGGDIESIIKPEMGQSFYDAISAKASNGVNPMNPVGDLLPPYRKTDDAVLTTVLKDSGTTKKYLELADADLATRQLLQDSWLESKGLIAGEPIDLDVILNLKGKDMDMVRVLFPEGQGASPQAGVAGWNSKVEIFDELKRLGKGEDDAIVTLSQDTFERIMRSGSKKEMAELRKIAIKENEVKEKLAKYSQTMVNMVNEGRIPLPKNRVEMDTFLEGVMKSDPIQQEKFIKIISEQGDDALLDLQGSVYHELIRRTKVKGKLVDQASPKDNTLWDPFEMANELEANKEFLLQLIGREGYDNLVVTNRGLQALTRPVKDDGKQLVPRVAMTSSGFNFWASNALSPVTDRIGAVVMGMQVRHPLKKVINAKTYDNYQNSIIKGAFLSAKGLQMLNSEAEASPEMNSWINGNLQAIKDEANEQRKIAFPKREINDVPPSPPEELLEGMSQFQTAQ